jgi:hypothetical protein
MDKKERNIIKLPSTISLIIAVLGLLFQLATFVANQKYDVHYLNDQYFFYINMLIIIFTCFGVLPFVQKKQKLLFLGGFLLLFQFGLSFLGNTHQTIVSTSPKEQNVFIVKSEKKSGVAYYQQNVYYRFPQLTEFLPKPSAKNKYLFFGLNEVPLTYSISDKYQIVWPLEDVAVLNYIASDGTAVQFVRPYNSWALSDGKERSQLVEAIGDWQGSGCSLSATGQTYTLKLGNKTIKLDPTYQTMVADSISIYKDAQGVALATFIYDPDSRELLIVPADSNKGQVFHLERESKRLY